MGNGEKEGEGEGERFVGATRVDWECSLFFRISLLRFPISGEKVQ